MCDNLDYIKQQIETNELIYIDTCSLLDVTRLSNFIDGSKIIFIENSKKIIVHYSVLEELYKIRFSSNDKKRNAASKALDIIFDNSDLFIIENNPNSDKDTECFADIKLLSTLFERRRNHKQLLISNDHALTSDAFNFNYIASVSGNRINVCYLNHFGNMNACDCVKENKHENMNRNNEAKNNKNTNLESKVIIKKEIIKEEPSLIEKYGIPTLTFFLGGLFEKYAIYYLKKVLN